VTDGNGPQEMTHPTLFDMPQPKLDVADKTKTCADCNNSYALNKYVVVKKYASGVLEYHRYCRSCSLKHRRIRYDANRTGLYQRLYVKQNGCCYICKTWRNRLCIDHDHKTGIVRALLCNSCNAAAGFVNDNPLRAYWLYLYLQHSDLVVEFRNKSVGHA